MLAVLALIAAVTFLRLAAHCATQFRKLRSVKTGELLKLHKSKVSAGGSVHPQYSIDGAWWHPDVFKNGLNGIDRVDNTRGYEKGNVVPCCGTCNLLKGARTVDEFLAQIFAIAEFQKTARGIEK